AEQQAEVAKVASALFGSPVAPNHVIGETLRRSTPSCDAGDPSFVAALTERVRSGPDANADLEAFVTDPLSRWIESTFGITEETASGRLVRVTPRAISGD